MDGKIKELKPEKPATPDAPLNLRQKLVACMNEIERVEKRGENRAQGYTYVMAADIIDAARKALATHGIAFSATEVDIDDRGSYETRSGATMYVVRVKMLFRFMDADSDEQLEVSATGEGQDTGDKGINKAKTAAIKYILQQNLLMSTGDDPEDERGDKADHERTAGPAPKAQGPVTMVRDRLCPSCGKPLIYKRNEQQWQCWRSKGGCESTFTEATLQQAEVAADLRRSQQQDDLPDEPPTVVEDPGRTTEKIVATDAQLKQIYDLIAQATDPELTTKQVLSQCEVKDLADLKPNQAEWLIGSLTRKMEARDKGKRK